MIAHNKANTFNNNDLTSSLQDLVPSALKANNDKEDKENNDMNIELNDRVKSSMLLPQQTQKKKVMEASELLSKHARGRVIK